ncbi:MAG: hypothetical protein A2X94_16245 [Bdellovibrionales bacterium GWB1_55_8]|nr:MAG: hypothetical protein A2X94_16245 [Bdellovibrionales bacterium GWB1_55_8]
MFTAQANGHSITMDSKPPLGGDSAMTPKQLVIAGLCGCTGMDVAALMKKHKQPLEKLSVEADVTMTEGAQPIVYKSIHLTFKLEGQLDLDKVRESVLLSQTKFCGVSAVLWKAVPMEYSIEVNGQIIGSGKPEFKSLHIQMLDMVD